VAARRPSTGLTITRWTVKQCSYRATAGRKTDKSPTKRGGELSELRVGIGAQSRAARALADLIDPGRPMACARTRASTIASTLTLSELLLRRDGTPAGSTQRRIFRAVASVGEDGQRTTESQHAGGPPDGMGVAAWEALRDFLSCDLKHAGSSVSLCKCNLPPSTTAVIFSNVAQVAFLATTNSVTNMMVTSD
jgi:hypothetical protein